MQVQQTIEWSLLFAGPVSAWWMAPAMLAAAAAVFLFYRGQYASLPAWGKAGLVGLRIAVLLALLFVAFKPSLIVRRILTYPGRILMLVDDSASMTARDTFLPDAAALRTARRVGRLPAGPDSVPDAMAQNMDQVIAALREFERYSRGADRTQDAFWNRAGSARDAIGSLFDEAMRDAAAIPGLPAEEKGRVETWIRSVQEAKESLATFFTGARDPGARVYDDYERSVAALAQDMLALQAEVDGRAIASGDATLKSVAAAVRDTPRLDLVRATLARLQPGLSKQAPGQAIQVVSLMAKTRTDIDAFRPADLQPREGPTDLTGRLKDLLTEKSDFPLAAVALIGDGRNLGGTPLPEVIREAVSRQVPVYTAGAGDGREPGDLALVSVRAPSFAVKGAPVRVRVAIRNSMGTLDAVRLQVFLAGAAVVSDSIALVPGVQTATLVFTPAETGFFKYTVKVDSVVGEVFPLENNSLDFITNVRDDKLRVLFLDWKPRWETRFALNVMQRLPYVDLNSIIALVQEDSVLQRGFVKGTWPQNAQSLDMYDLVVLGDLPDDLLTKAELEALEQWVTRKGKTLCVLGSQGSPPVGRGTPLAGVLDLSTTSTGAVARVVTDGPGDVRLSPAGRVHVLTRTMAGILPEVGLGAKAVSREGLVLAGAGKPATPLLAVRYVGAGKTLSILGDDLWRQLHPGGLDAHTELYAALVTWSLEGGFRAPPAAAPELAVDARRFPPGAAVQVWLRGGASNAVIEAVRGDAVLASAGVTPMGAGVPPGAVFADLTPGEVVFRLKDDPAALSERVELLSDKRELVFLARDPVFLHDLAASTGARYVEFDDVNTCFRTMAPKQRIETHERVWRLWGWGPLLSLLILALTAQWGLRKWMGLV